MTTSITGPEKIGPVDLLTPTPDTRHLTTPDVTTGSIMSKSFADTRSKIWNNLLSAQVSLFADAELAWLNGQPEWQAATSIADIGCGNGDYLACLDNAFPHMNFVGYDTSDELISIARRKFNSRKIAFHRANITDSAQKQLFDGAVLRFVVQHLNHTEKFFRSLRDLVRANGFAVIIEPNFEASCAYPELNSFNGLINAYEALAKELGSARSMLHDQNDLGQIIGTTWKVSRVDRIHSMHDRESWNVSALTQILYGWLKTIEATQQIDWDYNYLRQEIDDWLQADGHQINIVLNATVLKPVSD